MCGGDAELSPEFYCDMKHGGNYWTFLSEELPALMRSFFPLSSKRSDNAVAGLSMGGYGAARWLLAKPEVFIAGASLSGALNLRERMKEILRDDPDRMLAESLRLTFGEGDLTGSPEDLLSRLPRAVKSKQCPPLLQICGTEDFLYRDNLEFKQAAEECGYPLTYREKPGAHEWGFWDEGIRDVLAWLPEQGFGL